MIHLPPRSPLFPYTTLFRSAGALFLAVLLTFGMSLVGLAVAPHVVGFGGVVVMVDRKSTRLNSSHASRSYAVLCFKKKTTAPGGRSESTTALRAIVVHDSTV